MANLFVRDLREIAYGLSEDPSEWPHIPCPTCKRSGLSLIPGSLVVEEAATSKSWHSHDDWEPDWTFGRFHCVLQCYKKSCDVVRIVGTTNVYLEEHERGYRTVLSPLFFMPELPLVESFGSCPVLVRERIEAAATVLWADPSSAANRLRSAIEALMDHHGIPRKWASGNGKVYDISLHGRIERFKLAKSEFAEAADLMLAVKWTGNAGSHGSAVQVSDVLDAVEILDRTLHHIYDTSGDEIKKKAADITARKGMPASQFTSLPMPPF
ncbi:DUF4145 domain-containing protein [Streptomyces sp. NPDC026673]|uniref:DUF4145 domain-containing protein n=1 Tax=Streptomyces sp. NPDC026673 TaxID=3155724 RepID=UPI0033E50145